VSRPALGDDSFAAWYRASYRDLLATMVVAAGNVELASDVTDEAFARACERWHRVRHMESPNGWTYRVAVNLLRRSWRRQTAERAAMKRLAPAVEARAPGPDISIEVWDLIQRLPARMRVTVALRYVADLSEPEIGRVMGVRDGTVARQLHDARRRLADLVDRPEAALSPTEGNDR
jgi:RNA polymerase sigma-70 factor (ECF subfamily)